ncbi:MFS transporter [Neorhizobium sp. NCHU2750]|uniref:MFS transporter n=1 Tax=Neorhizobium sp. NCHU2750 TaxID=1825976 RepID=UPI000E762DA9
MENLDATVITPAIPAMARSFDVKPVDLSSGISAYMLTLGVFIPVSGWMVERFGARRVFTSAILIFTLASLLCGLSSNLPFFIAARVAQGIGGAMMVPVGRLVVLRQTPKNMLVRAIAVLTWPALVAPVLGPPLGGLLVDYGDWRWIFWLNLPLGIIAIITALRLVPQDNEARARDFDWIGFLLSGAGVFCLMFVADVLSRPEASMIVAIGPLLAGLMLVFFAVRHLNHTPNAMLELSALRLPTFSTAIYGGSLFRMGVSAVPFLLPAMFQIGFGYGSFEAGSMLMAVFAGNFLAKPMTTPIMRNFGFRRVLLVNGALNALLIAACALFGPTMPLWLILLLLFLGGMTRSMQFTALNTIAFADVPAKGMSSANTLFSTVFQLAIGLGIALGAVGWRIGDQFPSAADPAMPFRIAFLIVAAISSLGLIDSFRLAANAGDAVSRARKTKPRAS